MSDTRETSSEKACSKEAACKVDPRAEEEPAM